MSEPLLELVIPIRLTNSNTGRTHAWQIAANRRKKIEMQLRATVGTFEPFDHPVRIQLIRVLGAREQFWDYDSGLRGNAKELIDSLVSIGVFVDDGPKWIKGVEFLQDKSQRANGPAVAVKVFQAQSED